MLEQKVLRKLKSRVLLAFHVSARKKKCMKLKGERLSKRVCKQILSGSFSNFISILTESQFSHRVKEATSHSVEYLVGENVGLQQRVEATEASLARAMEEGQKLTETLKRVKLLKARAVECADESSNASIKLRFFTNLRFSALYHRLVKRSTSEKQTYFQSSYMQTTLVIWYLHAKHSRMAQRFCEKQISYQRNHRKWRTFEYFCLLLEGKSIRADLTKAWIDSAQEVENHKQTSEEMLAQLVEVQRQLDDEKSARELAEQQLEHSLSLGESLQTSLLVTEQQMSRQREEVESLKMAGA
eukprot:768174-Hanusia_phi.AAC.5